MEVLAYLYAILKIVNYLHAIKTYIRKNEKLYKLIHFSLMLNLHDSRISTDGLLLSDYLQLMKTLIKILGENLILFLIF